MIKIHKQVKARQDLKNIWLYSFRKWGEQQADKYYDEIIHGIDLLKDNPEIGVSCDDIRLGYRRFKIKEHEIYYKIASKKIDIIRVLHESMNSLSHL